MRLCCPLKANAPFSWLQLKWEETEQAITDEIRSLGPGKEIKVLFRFVILFLGDQNENIRNSQYHMTEIHIIALLI